MKYEGIDDLLLRLLTDLVTRLFPLDRTTLPATFLSKNLNVSPLHLFPSFFFFSSFFVCSSLDYLIARKFHINIPSFSYSTRLFGKGQEKHVPL